MSSFAPFFNLRNLLYLIVYQTVDVYTLDKSFSEALAAHGIVRTSMSYSEYEAIESTWLLPNDMIESIKRAYPELALIDMSSWTYGDYRVTVNKRIMRKPLVV